MSQSRAASRVSGLGTTIFAEMSALAVQTNSINLGQGFPDTDGPHEILESASKAILTGANGANQYPPGPGIPALRRAIADHQRRYYGFDLDPDTEVLVTTGATEAIAAALLGLVEPGDEVLALEPYYDSYAACISMASGVRVPVTLHAPDFRLDIAALRTAVTPRTRLMVVNTPHNPTGTVLTHAEMAAIAEVAVAHNLIVISDEVYEHLVFDGVHVPMRSLPGMAERTLTIGSAGKSFSVTGWKIGWATGPADLVSATRAAKQFLTYVSGGPLQPAVAFALDNSERFLPPLQQDLRHQRDLLCGGLADLGFPVYVPAGTYFATTDVRGFGFTSGDEFCRWLPGSCGVVAIPSQVFYDNVEAGVGLVRWAFCKREEVLVEALGRLRQGIASHHW